MRRLKGDGTITYRKDRKRWVYRFFEDNKRRSLSARTRKELNEKIEKLKNKKLNEEYNKETLLNIVEKIYKDKLEKNIITSGSYERALYSISKIREHYIADMPIAELRVADIDSFSNGLKHLSNSSIGKIIGLIKSAFALAVDKEIINKNIMNNYVMPKSNKATKKVRALTRDEHKELKLLIPSSKYYPQYIIALNTGMRMGEINALHYNDIDLKNKTIHINKTVSRGLKYIPEINEKTKTEAGVRKIPMTNTLYFFLYDFLKDKEEDFLFLNAQKEPITTSAITSELKRLTKKEFSSHMLRHTFATRAIESGMPPVILSRILGHRDISTTLNTYTDVFNEFQNTHIEQLEKYLKDI